MAFDQGPVAGTVLTADSIHSPNFASGSSGWAIFRDGSSEFQNVLVRGTITGSTIVGSTIVGGTVTGGIFKSANFDNTAHVGFELNGTNAADNTATPPVPANTIQVYSNFVVGPSTASNVALGILAGQPSAQFFSGTANETGPGRVFAAANGAEPLLAIQSGISSNGQTEVIFQPPTTTAVGIVDVATKNVAAIPGNGSIVAQFQVSAEYQSFLLSNNKISTGLQPLVIGNGANTLNFDNGGLQANGGPLALQPTGGRVSSPGMRATGAASGAGAAASIAAVAFAALPGAQATSVTFSCPPSGVVVVSLTAQVFQVAATVVGDFVALSPNVVNNTQATTPFGAGFTRSAVWTSIVAGAAGGSLTITRTLTISGCGNDGDSVTVSIFGAVNIVNRFSVFRTELSVTPSL